MGRRGYRTRTALRPEILDRVSYVDSVFLIMPRRMEAARFNDLKRSLEREQGTRGKVHFERVSGGEPGGQEWFSHVLSVHQPTVRSIELLIEDGRGRFYGVHVALDLTVADLSDAFTLEQYLLRHLHKNREPANPSERTRSVTHIGQGMAEFVDGESGEIVKGLRRRGSSIATYPDKSSKVTLDYCAHLEYRIAGTRSLGREKFPSLRDVLRIDHVDFWRKRLLLLEPPTTTTMTAAVAEAMARQAATTKEPVQDRETRLRMAEKALGRAFGPHQIDYRKAHGVDIAYALQETKLAGKTSPFRLFTQLRSDWALPTNRTNALWLTDRSRRTGLEPHAGEASDTQQSGGSAL